MIKISNGSLQPGDTIVNNAEAVLSSGARPRTSIVVSVRSCTDHPRTHSIIKFRGREWDPGCYDNAGLIWVDRM